MIFYLFYFQSNTCTERTGKNSSDSCVSHLRERQRPNSAGPFGNPRRIQRASFEYKLAERGPSVLRVQGERKTEKKSGKLRFLHPESGRARGGSVRESQTTIGRSGLLFKNAGQFNRPGHRVSVKQ